MSEKPCSMGRMSRNENLGSDSCTLPTFADLFAPSLMQMRSRYHPKEKKGKLTVPREGLSTKIHD